MPEPVPTFQSLPTEYRKLVHLAEERHGISIAPLRALSGGWSGAILYLVRVASVDSGGVEHLILKLDRKHPKASADEITRHRAVQEGSPPSFARDHIPELAFDRVEADGALAIFYTIAGQSLRNCRTLSSYRRQPRLQRLFAATNSYLLEEWNADFAFETVPHPQELMEGWLGFRLEAGQKIERFLQEACGLPAGTPGFLVEGNLLPNPLRYARDPASWGSIRSMDVAVGRQHGDLNTNNVLASFSRQGQELEGYYLIDFAQFKENKPLLFDHRYLEMSYLVHVLSDSSLSAVVDLINRYSEHAVLPPDETPIELAGVNAAVREARTTFGHWVHEKHPSLADDLWGQYWLAGAAAGLSFCHKTAMADEHRLAGLIYGAANLKQYFNHFDLPLPTEAAQLYAEGQKDDLAGERIRPSRALQHNLPAPLTEFVGRMREMEEIRELLLRPEVHLVSLTGPGGTGKTRLALEAARGLLDRFPQGVYFVDLAGIRDPALVVPTTAHTLDLREGSGQSPLEKLKDYLADREVLLLLDNFEQVAAAAVDLAELLSAAPGLKVVVTSRVPLQLRGEHEYPVSSLEMPPELDLALDETLTYESVMLFHQQAKAVQPRFEITEDNRSAVVEICRRLDGLPLAIEIAAARIKMLTPDALLGRLDQSLAFLVSPARDMPDRQRTLRGTIDWSYQLLEAEVQRLFARLGIFAGGFTLEAAQAICRSMEEEEVFDGVETLLNNSLLRQVDSATEELRFDMLQTIREFALEKAEQAGIMAELEGAHCGYFTQLAGSGMEGGIYGPDSVLWMKIYDQEHDNYRQAMSWALQHPDDGAEPLMVMMTQLSWFWYRYGYLQEGSEWTERALEATEAGGASPGRAFALAARGSLALWSGDLLIAAQRTREAMEMAQRLDLELVVAICKMTYGTTLVNQGRDKEAYAHLVDSVELYDGLDQRWLKGTALVHLANVSLGLGDPEQALDWLDRARPLLNTTGDVWTMAFGLGNYGEVARAQGDYEKAEEFYRRTEALYKQADSKGDQARLITALGYIALHRGEDEEAKTSFLESLDEFRKLGNVRGIAEALAGVAVLAAELGEQMWAAPLLSAAEARLKDLDGVWWPADRVEIDRAKERMGNALGEDYQALWAQGQLMPLEQAIEYAERGW